jgi:hypothetical protein
MVTVMPKSLVTGCQAKTGRSLVLSRASIGHQGGHQMLPRVGHSVVQDCKRYKESSTAQYSFGIGAELLGQSLASLALTSSMHVDLNLIYR